MDEKVVAAFAAAGLPERLARQYPHEFSAGMRRRAHRDRALLPASIPGNELRVGA